MQTDLLIQLLDKMIAVGRPPDILSVECDENDDTIIQFEWFTGRVMTFGYTAARYDAVWKRFNSHWQKAA